MTIPESFRDPMWGSVGAVAGVGALVIGLIALLGQRRRKQLSYEIICNASVLRAEEAIAGKLEIIFEQKAVRDVQLIELRLVNSGNQPITVADYDQPVSLSFGNQSRVLSAEVAAGNPNTLKAGLGIEPSRVLVAPLLLNGGDSITLRILVAGYKDAPSVEGRIIGVSRIRRVKSELGWFMASLVAQLLAVSMLAFVGRGRHSHNVPEVPFTSIDFLLLGSVGSLFLFSLWALLGRSKMYKIMSQALRGLLEQS